MKRGTIKEFRIYCKYFLRLNFFYRIGSRGQTLHYIFISYFNSDYKMNNKFKLLKKGRNKYKKKYVASISKQFRGNVI